ncbi:chemotaxis protein CheW [Deefgea tanakiae]|jgi:twitching motility protein PilI|uniref:Chemotaxis protein CheW n=1 Tax=Deefgea tanakiae TaxID=2865840 RepID=A0ABX8Z579_9NEIS|nr:chemotaxis protein CheW [Deefgea tanakiae]QZA77733.1 chemotaxis protein CheW [Deefgea tanakiae]
MAKRITARVSLREYQQGVMQRLQTATTVAQVDARLGLQIGNDNWLVDLADVSEVMPMPSVTGVPLAHSWFKGVANIRGNLVSVVDLPAFFGQQHQGFTLLARLVLLQPRHLPHASVLVNKMMGLKHLADLEQEALEGTEPAWVGGKYKDAAGQSWKVLDVVKLVNEPAFLQTGIA